MILGCVTLRGALGDFPSSPVVKTPHFHCREHARVRSLVRETKILHAAQRSQKQINK